MHDKKQKKVIRLDNEIAYRCHKNEMARKADEKALEKFKEKPFYLKG